jgi:hypothetical protein
MRSAADRRWAAGVEEYLRGIDALHTESTQVSNWVWS